MKIHGLNNRTPEERAAIERKRGIVRDSSGHIVRSKEWLKERIAFLKAKKTALKAEFDIRMRNIDQEVAQRIAEQKGAK